VGWQNGKIRVMGMKDLCPACNSYFFQRNP